MSPALARLGNLTLPEVSLLLVIIAGVVSERVTNESVNDFNYFFHALLKKL